MSVTGASAGPNAKSSESTGGNCEAVLGVAVGATVIFEQEYAMVGVGKLTGTVGKEGVAVTASSVFDEHAISVSTDSIKKIVRRKIRFIIFDSQHPVIVENLSSMRWFLQTPPVNHFARAKRAQPDRPGPLLPLRRVHLHKLRKRQSTLD